MNDSTAIEKDATNSNILNFFNEMPQTDKVKFTLEITSTVSNLVSIGANFAEAYKIREQIKLIKEEAEQYIKKIRAETEEYKVVLSVKVENYIKIMEHRLQIYREGVEDYRKIVESDYSKYENHLELIRNMMREIPQKLEQEQVSPFIEACYKDMLSTIQKMNKLLNIDSLPPFPDFADLHFDLPNPPEYRSTRHSHSTKQKYAQTVDVDADEI